MGPRPNRTGDLLRQEVGTQTRRGEDAGGSRWTFAKEKERPQPQACSPQLVGKGLLPPKFGEAARCWGSPVRNRGRISGAESALAVEREGRGRPEWFGIQIRAAGGWGPRMLDCKLGCSRVVRWGPPRNPQDRPRLLLGGSRTQRPWAVPSSFCSPFMGSSARHCPHQQMETKARGARG